MRAVWITRARPGAEATVDRVRALGFEAVVEPLLVVRPIAGAAVDLEGVAAVVFTSANAVAAFAALTGERALRVFTVGDATAAAARQAGFTRVESAGGDARDLVALVIARRDELEGPLFYAAAAEPARDLAAALAPAGIGLRQAALYETVVAPPSPELIGRLRDIDSVLLHSARAAGALADVLARHPAPHLLALCLSNQVAAPLSQSSLAAIEVAASPDEAALLTLIGRARTP